jgi:hypothetical protein
MGMPEEDKGDTRTLLIVCLAICVCFVVVTLALPFMPNGELSHPPQVSITREHGPAILGTDKIKVIYKGGIDDAFVGDFKIKVSNGIEESHEYDAPKPLINYPVAIIEVPANEVACVNVSAIDKAVRVYRPIGNLCL